MSDAKDYIFPRSGLVRINKIIGDPRANPPIPAFIPVGKTTWWRWVKEGKAPASIKLGPHTTVWRAEQIIEFSNSLALTS